jgi:hypothetical protein
MPQHTPRFISQDKLDPFTYVAVYEVKDAFIALLQGIFESYEGIGLVRTIQKSKANESTAEADTAEKSLIAIVYTKDTEDACNNVMRSSALVL